MPRSRWIPAVIVALAASAVLVAALVQSSAAGPGADTSRGTAACRTDSAGYCTVNHSFGQAPASAVLTPVYYPSTRPFFMGLATTGNTVNQLRVRAMFGSGNPVSNLDIEFSYDLAEGAPAPTTTTVVQPTSTTTTTPPVTTTTTTPPAPGGFPTPATAGVPAGTVFSTVVSGNHRVDASDTVIDGWHITGVLEVYGRNVTVRNSRIDGGVQNFRAPSSSFTLTDSTVGPQSGCSWGVTVWGSNYTALRVHSRNMENGFSTPAGNLTIRDSYSTTCSPDSSAHADGFETCCDINAQYPAIVLDHNTIDQRGASSATAPIDLAEALHVLGAVITNNLVAGGAYSMYLEAYTPSPKWTVAGNKWVDGAWAFGPLTTDGTCGNIDWGTGNDIVTVDSEYRITSTVRALSCNS